MNPLQHFDKVENRYHLTPKSQAKDLDEIDHIIDAMIQKLSAVIPKKSPCPECGAVICGLDCFAENCEED